MAKDTNGSDEGGTATPTDTARKPAAERTYVVCREYTLASLLDMLGVSLYAAPDVTVTVEDGDGEPVEGKAGLSNDDGLDLDMRVFVALDTTEAGTTKAARTTVAKLRVPREQLITDSREKGGVVLNAIAESALRTGKAPVRLVEEII